MVTVNIALERLPRALRNYGDQIPFAASNALNNVAFGARRYIQNELLPNNLTLRNKHTQRGIRVNKSNKNTLRAEVGSIDYYSERQVVGSLERPNAGFVVDGKRYLLIPNPKRRTPSGRLRKIPKSASKPFAVKTDKGDLVLVVRKAIKRRTNNLIPLGILVDRKRYSTKVNWDVEVDRFITKEWDREFRLQMVRAARSAR